MNLRGRLAVVLVRGDLAAQEHHFLFLAERERAEVLAHAELAHHAARQAGGAFDVVRGAGRQVVEDQVLRGAAAHQHAQRPEQSRSPAPPRPIARRCVALRQSPGSVFRSRL